MEEGFHRTGALGIDLVETVDRRIQPEAAFDLPADTVHVGHLPRPNPRREIREEQAIPFRREDPNEAEMQGMLGPPHMHLGSNGPAVEEQEVLIEERIEVGPRAELLGDVAAREIVDLGLPVVFEADDQAPPMLVAGLQPGQAGRGKIGEHATAPPRRLDR
jgi:hypothetical protein